VKTMTDKGPAFIPYSQFDRDKADAIPFDKALKHRVTQLRSVPHNNLYWSVLRVVLDNTDAYVRAEDLHEALLKACNITEIKIDLDGTINIVAGSAAFDKMTKPDYELYFEQALRIICTLMMPGTEPDELVETAKARCGMRRAA